MYLISFTRVSTREMWGKRGKSYLQSIYFLLHDHNPTITPNDHSHELLDSNAYKYEPYTRKTSQNIEKEGKSEKSKAAWQMVLQLEKQNPLTLILP